MIYEIDLISFPHGGPKIQSVTISANSLQEAWDKGRKIGKEAK